MNNFKKFFYLLNPQERKQAILLIIMILLMALLDMIGIDLSSIHDTTYKSRIS